MLRDTIMLLGTASLILLAACNHQSDDADSVAESSAADATSATDPADENSDSVNQTANSNPHDSTAGAIAEEPTPFEDKVVKAVDSNSPNPTALVSSQPSQSDCNVELGKTAIVQCTVCHNTEQARGHSTGPNLWGVHGRKAGAGEGFAYSRRMSELEVTWNDANLDAFLTRPQGFAPGTSMAFGGIRDEARRKALICYLRTLR